MLSKSGFVLCLVPHSTAKRLVVERDHGFNDLVQLPVISRCVSSCRTQIPDVVYLQFQLGQIVSHGVVDVTLALPLQRVVEHVDDRSRERCELLALFTMRLDSLGHSFSVDPSYRGNTTSTHLDVLESICTGLQDSLQERHVRSDLARHM